MEQSDNENEKNDNADNDKPPTEEATTSKETNLPEQTAHNMNDLIVYDFNSADEVRQKMKAVLIGKLPQNFTEESDNITLNKNNDDAALNRPTKLPTQEQFQKEENKPDFREDKLRKLRNTVIRKRRGRPPKAGSSKSKRKSSITAIYTGKLSNVVNFKKHYRSDDDIDFDDFLIY